MKTEFIWVVWGEDYVRRAIVSAMQADYAYRKAGRRDEIHLIIYYLGSLSIPFLGQCHDLFVKKGVQITISSLNVSTPKHTSQVHTPRYHALFMGDRPAFYFDTDVMVLRPFPEEVFEHKGLQHFAYSHFGGGWLEGELSKVQDLCEQPWYEAIWDIPNWRENFYLTTEDPDLGHFEGMPIDPSAIPIENQRVVINSGFAYFGGEGSEEYRLHFIPKMIDYCSKSQKWGFDELLLAAMAKGGHIPNHKVSIFPGINRMPKIERMNWKRYVKIVREGDCEFLESTGSEIAIHTGAHLIDPNVSIELNESITCVQARVLPRMYGKPKEERVTLLWVVWGERYLPLVVGSAFMAARAYYGFTEYDVAFKVYVIGRTRMEADQQAFLERHGIIVEHRPDVVVPPNQSRSEEPRFQLMQEHGEPTLYLDADFYLMRPIPGSAIAWRGIQTFGFSPYARVEETIMVPEIRDHLEDLCGGHYPGLFLPSYVPECCVLVGDISQWSQWTDCFYQSLWGDHAEELMWGQFNLGLFFWEGGAMPWFDRFREMYEGLIHKSPDQLTCGELAYTVCVRRGLIDQQTCIVIPGLNRIITTRDMPWWRVVKLGEDLGHEVIVPRNKVEISAHVGHYLGNPAMYVRWLDGRLRLFVSPE